MVIAGIFGVANHIYFNRNEPTKNTFYGALAILLLEPLGINVLNHTLCLSSTSTSSLISITRILLTYTSFYFALCTSIIIYRLSPFHPLAEVPGPAIARISKLYSIWIWLKGKRHLEHMKYHEQYGPVVRIAPNEISVIDMDSIRTVLGPGGLPKGQSYSSRRDERTEGSLLALTGEPRVKRRRLWARGMAPESIRNYEDLIRVHATKLLERLSERIYEKVDLGVWLNYFTFDFTVDMAFGDGSHMLQEAGDKDGMWDTMEHAAFQMEAISHVPWLANLGRDLSFLPKPALRIRDVGLELASNRAKLGSRIKDLWYHLSDDAGLEKEKPSLRAVISDGVLAIMAGADTTSAAMRHFFWMILAHPQYYKQLQEEVDATFPSEADALDSSKYCDMPFLNACLNESLRLLPPLPTGGLREVPHGSGGKVIGGFFIPEGTQVHVPPHSVHRNSSHFSPSPDEFLPARWLLSKSSDLKLLSHNTDAFIPFSFGPENCIGKNLARKEMMMTISLLMQKLDFRFADGFDWEAWPRKLKDYFVYSREPLMVMATPRASTVH